jgi:hypothetical protein
VPQRIEPGRRVRDLSDAQVTARQEGGLHHGAAEFRAVIAALPPARRDVLARLADWAGAMEQDGLVRLFTTGAAAPRPCCPTFLPTTRDWWPLPAAEVPTTCSFGAAYLSAVPRAPSPRSKLLSEPS